MQETLVQISVWALPALLAITLHEAAHGWVAWKLGDDTAYRQGRVTFNPVKHIDPFGTIVLPLLLLFLSGGRLMFGYAKPVPVMIGRLRRPRRDMVWVAAAGPGMNVAVAVAAAVLIRLLPPLPGSAGDWLVHNLFNAVWLNVLLAVFNMLPLPPLDGGRVAVGLLPPRFARPLARLEPLGIPIILATMFLLPLLARALGVDLPLFDWLVIVPAEALTKLILAGTAR